MITSLMQDLKESLIKARKKRLRIRTIFLNFRKLSKFNDFSDLALLTFIVEGLVELNSPYSKKEIYSAFKEVSRDDYDKSQKRELLKGLIKQANNRSVFSPETLKQ